MAERTVDPIYVPFQVTTPAATLATAPLFTAVPIAPGRLVEVELQVPPGHAGQTGIRVELAQQQIIPFSTVASWIVGDDYVHDFETDVEVGSGLRVATFNVGQYDHTHYLRFKMRRLANRAVTTGLRLVNIEPQAS